jgi:hypothetical protein
MSDNSGYTLGVGEPDIEIEQQHAEVFAGVGRRKIEQLEEAGIENDDLLEAVETVEDLIGGGGDTIEIPKTDLMILHDEVAASMLHFDRLLHHQGAGAVPVDMMAAYRQAVYTTDLRLMQYSTPVYIKKKVLSLLLNAGESQLGYLESAMDTGRAGDVSDVRVESMQKAVDEAASSLTELDDDIDAHDEVVVDRYALRLLAAAARGQQTDLRESGDEQWKYYAKAWDLVHEALQNKFRMQDFGYENPQQ